MKSVQFKNGEISSKNNKIAESFARFAGLLNEFCAKDVGYTRIKFCILQICDLG